MKIEHTKPMTVVSLKVIQELYEVWKIEPKEFPGDFAEFMVGVIKVAEERDRLRVEVERLNKRVKDLDEFIENWADHDPDCDERRMQGGPCVCGYDDAKQLLEATE